MFFCGVVFFFVCFFFTPLRDVDCRRTGLVGCVPTDFHKSMFYVLSLLNFSL